MCFQIIEEKNCLMQNELKRAIKKTLLYLSITKIKKWMHKIIFKNPPVPKLNKYIEKEIYTINIFSKALKERIEEGYTEIIVQENFISQSLGNMIKGNKISIQSEDIGKVMGVDKYEM